MCEELSKRNMWVAVRLDLFFAADEWGHVVYLLLAYDHFPDDPVICLCLAIASFGRAMQRQADNRHHLIAQVRIPPLHCSQFRIHIPRLGDGVPHTVP